MSAEVLIGGTSSIFGPAIRAVTLGIVGREAFGIRQGCNQTFNSAGNVTALSIGFLGYLISKGSVFFFVVYLAIPTILALLLISPAEIDYEIARGAPGLVVGAQVIRRASNVVRCSFVLAVAIGATRPADNGPALAAEIVKNCGEAAGRYSNQRKQLSVT